MTLYAIIDMKNPIYICFKLTKIICKSQNYDLVCQNVNVSTSHNNVIIWYFNFLIS